MPVENEARFHLPEEALESTIERLREQRVLGIFSLQWEGSKEHVDTYFDADGNLRERGWSLRVRARGDDVRATLKRPISGPNEVYGEAREEIENTRNESLFDAVSELSDILYGAGVIGGKPQNLMAHLALDGLISTLQFLGLKDLFAVQTTRHKWIVQLNDEDIAELVVDDSYYEIGLTGHSDPIRECRIEVELLDPSRSQLLDDVCRLLTSRHSIREVHESKFERGMLYFDTRMLREKLETKISVRDRADYDHIIGRIDGDPNFMHQYRFSPLQERVISDIYFDTSDQRLFQAGWYLRLRRELQSHELVFRRLTKDVKYGEVLQGEIVAEGTGDAFNRRWKLIQEWLKSIDLEFETGRSSLAEIEEVLPSMGLGHVLSVRIMRRPWIVERIDGADRKGGTRPDHVAKLKYDRIEFRKPNLQGGVLTNSEFEATGVEDESAAPQDLKITSYEAFVAQFMEACAHVTSDAKVTRKISAKYFEGMVNLGIARYKPDWLSDGRLAYRVSLLRDVTSEEPKHYWRERELEEGQRNASEATMRAKSEITDIIGHLNERISSSGRSTAGSEREFLSSLDQRLRGIEDTLVRLGSNINFTVVQNSSQASLVDNSVAYDVHALADGLTDMLALAAQDESRSGFTREIGAITAARDAALRNDEASLIANLKKAGRYALDLAKEVSSSVVSAFIEAKLGIK